MLATLARSVLLVMCASGCSHGFGASPSDPGPFVVYRVVPDFRSSLDLEAQTHYRGYSPSAGPVLGVPYAGNVGVSAEREILAAAMTLTRVSDGLLVPGEGRPLWASILGVASVSGHNGHQAVSFTPVDPLEDGWHVLRLDVGGLRALGANPIVADDGPVRGDVVYARFRLDHAAMWVTTTFQCSIRPGDPIEGEDCVFGGLYSEPQPESAWRSASVEVRYNNALVECGPAYLPDSAVIFHEFGFTLRCPFPPDAAEIEIRLISANITDAAGERPAVHRRTFGSLLGASWRAEHVVPLLPEFGIAAADGASR